MNEITIFSCMICTTVLSLMLLKIYLNSFFDLESNKYKKMLGWLPFCMWQCIINLDIFIMMLPTTIRLLFSIGTLIMVVFIGYKGEFWKKFIVSAIYIALWMVLETLLWFIFGADRAETYVLAISVISKTLLLAIIIVIRFFMKNKAEKYAYTKYEKLLITMPLGSIVLCYILVEIGQVAGYEKIRIRVCLMAGALMLIAVNLSALYAKIMEKREVSQNIAFYIQQMELYKLQHIEEAITEIRETKHDIKQTITYLKNLAAKDNESFQKALTKVEEDMSAKGNIVGVSGCFPVDVILLKTMQTCQKGNIHFSTCIKIPQDLAVDDNDLCVLLGNALDNAIEAVEPLAESMREIYLDMEYKMGILDIKIKNRYQGKLEWIEYGKRLKSKKQEGIHGLGLQSMYKIVLKYHGKMNISQSNGFFSLHIWVYG